MNYKCSLTHDRCPYSNVNFNDPVAFDDDDGDSCPIQKYKDSSYRYKRASERGAVIRIDSTCRFLGIERTKRIKEEMRDWITK